MEKINKALIIVDAQRGFMPAEEGLRLSVPGFGELPVDQGEQIVAPLNRLVGALATKGFLLATTQDWHPYETAHFAADGEAPDYTITWPRHCVDGTAGAKLHPELVLPATNHRFIKGMEHLERGEDDLSYSGYYAIDPFTNRKMPDWLRHNNVREVVIGGLALDYCVGKTALDLKRELGIDVYIALDATRPVAPSSGDAMLQAFEEHGIATTWADDYIYQQQLAA